MPQSIASKLASAKSTLVHANASLPTNTDSAAKAKAAITPKPAVAPAPKPAPTISDELKIKQDNVHQYMNEAPKMHKGGPVPKSGVYRLQSGEHVLTAKEKQSMMAGMSALLKPSDQNMAGKLSTEKAGN